MCGILMSPAILVVICLAFRSQGRRLQSNHDRSSKQSHIPWKAEHASSNLHLLHRWRRPRSSGQDRKVNPLQGSGVLLPVNPTAGWQSAVAGHILQCHQARHDDSASGILALPRLAPPRASVSDLCTKAAHGVSDDDGDEDRLRFLRAALEGGAGIMDYMRPEDAFPGDELADGGDPDGSRLICAAISAASGTGPSSSKSGGTITQLAASWCEHFFDADDWSYMGQHNEMLADETRNSWFREAISRRLRGTHDHIVLDVGTGPFCILALFAARAGAHRVYAVEANPVAADLARKTVEQAEAADLVPAGVIQILEGSSTDVSLPERADLVVAEVVGEIATAEGIVCTLRDVQERHLKRPNDPASYIPQRVQTLCAPASYVVPWLLREPYSTFDFAEELGESPMHVGCNNAGLQLLSQPQLLEDLELWKPLPSLGHLHTSNLSFIIDGGLIADAKEEYSDVFECLVELGCRKKSARRLISGLAHSMAGLACWPRLVLESNPEKNVDGLGQELVVESRGARVYSGKHGPEGGDAEDVMRDEAAMWEEVLPESHWDTAIPLLSPRPLHVADGDSVHLKYSVEYGTEINMPNRYDFKGELLSATLQPN